MGLCAFGTTTSENARTNGALNTRTCNKDRKAAATFNDHFNGMATFEKQENSCRTKLLSPFFKPADGLTSQATTVINRISLDFIFSTLGNPSCDASALRHLLVASPSTCHCGHAGPGDQRASGFGQH